MVQRSIHILQVRIMSIYIIEQIHMFICAYVHNGRGCAEDVVAGVTDVVVSPDVAEALGSLVTNLGTATPRL